MAFVNLYFMPMCVWPKCMSVCQVCAVPTEIRRRQDVLVATDGCKPPCGSSVRAAKACKPLSHLSRSLLYCLLLICACVLGSGAHRSHGAHVVARGHLVVCVLSSHLCIDSRDGTLGLRLHSKCLSMLSHLTSS